ncbi:MAG TPA: patatin-like phospholipase family protein [Bacteroidota bacterium]|nr:patatin-like phospholipase family protein [Bacteroidota bacterium]
MIVRPPFVQNSGAQRSIVPFKKIQRPRVALVLSGGGARGIAHVGVIKALEEHHIPIDLIVGTSIGSLVGGLYASGYSARQLQTIVDTTNWNEVLSFTDEAERTNLFVGQKQAADKNLLTIRFDGLKPVIPSSFSSAQRLTTFINQLTLQGIYHPDHSFDDLKIPFRAVATDLISGKRVIISSGTLAEALRASITVPLLYSPVKRDSMELTDGGLISNIPVEVARDMNMDIVIAVDVSSPLRPADQLNAPWEVADQIIGIMAQLANTQSLQKATIVIKPDLRQHVATDFSNLDTLIDQGEEAADAAIPALLDSIKKRQADDFYHRTDIDNRKIKISTVRFIGAEIPGTMKSNLESLADHDSISVGKIKESVASIYALGDYRYAYAEIVVGDSSTAVTFVIAENPEIKDIELTGNSLITNDELLPLLDHLKGNPANADTTQAALNDILALYRDRGYSLARLRTVKLDSTSGILHIGIDEGVISHMSVEGTTKSRDWVIWRELPFTVGDVFTVSNAQQAIANIMATNLFDQVLIDVRYPGDRIEIVIEATEKKSEVLRAGLRVDSERDVQPSLELRDENFLGAATELGGQFAGGLRNRKYTLEFKANRIFNSYYTFDLNTYYDLRDIYTYENDPAFQSPTSFNRLRIGQYRQIKEGGAFSLGTQVERLGTVTAEYRLEQNQINFISGEGYSTDKFTLQTLRLSSTIDTQDEFPFPRWGSLMNISWETASSLAPGDIGYSKIFMSYEWFSTYFERNTIHPKILFGFADKTLPLSQQFSLGGEDSFYGLHEDDSRGRQIFVVNVEYRFLLPFRILWDTYLRARYDFGSIWPQPENISLKDLHHGIGAGIAIDTPAGKASISVGRSFFVRRDLLTQPLSLGPIVTYVSFGYPLSN